MKKLLVLVWVLGLCAEVSLAKPSDRGNFYGFGEMEILKLQWDIYTPIVVDLNRDGLNDLVVLNNSKARIELLLQKKNFVPGQITPIDLEAEDINDRFGKEKNWRFQRESYPLDLSVSSLVVADLNQDGFEDLIYYTPEGLFLVYQKPTDASDDLLTLPEWSAPEKIKVMDGLKRSKALAVGDLNNDGRMDLALLRENGVSLIWQQADGQFARPVKYPSTARQMRLVTIADMNGDGLNDLVITTSQQDYPVRIRLQDASGQLGPEERYDMPTPWMVKLKRMGETPQNQIVSISRQNGRVLISNWTDQEMTEKFPVHYYPLEETTSAKNRDVVAVDLDQDQLLDVVVSQPDQAEFLFYKSQPGLGLQSPQRFPGFMDMRKICAGPLGDSEKPSLVVYSRKEELVGISHWNNGRLTFPEIVDISGKPQAIELADINHDDRLDLVYVSKKSKESDEYFLGTILSLGTADQIAGEPVELPQLQDSPLGLRVGDIDHDGRRDILVLKSYGPLLLLRQKEDGTFTAQDQTGINSGLVNNVFPNMLSLVKLNGQDKTVLLLAQKNFTRSIYFDDQKGWTVLDQYPSIKSNSHITAATAGRFENDAVQIITYDNAHEQIALLSQQEDGTYRTTEEIDIGPVSAKRIILGHFDSTQTQSLLLVGNNKLVLVPVSRGRHTLQEIASFESQEKNTRYTSLAVGDINSDQVVDILLCDRGRNHVEILTFDGQAKLVSAYTFKVFEAPQGDKASNKKQYQPKNITLGDVTNDGLADLIITVHDRIIIYPQDSGTGSSL